MPRKSKLPAKEIVIADVEAGLTIEDMAEKYGVNRSAVSGYLCNHCIRIKRRTLLPAPEVISAYLQKGMPIRKIAGEIGCHPDVLYRFVKKHGLRDQPEQQIKVTEIIKIPQPGPTTIVNRYGVSLPRIPTLHGYFEVRA